MEEKGGCIDNLGFEILDGGVDVEDFFD